MGKMVGEKIKKLREEKNISQQELAEKTGIAQTTISKYEKNISSPDFKKMIKIADYFRVSLDYFADRYK